MSHSPLESQQVDAYMFGTQEKTSLQATAQGRSGSVMESGRHCFVTVKVQLSGGKQIQGRLPVLSDLIRLK